ncbi:MAG TPA: BlaI/MecI/CopY family transcriptional regulator [Steroidobacteraceae bacterium]|jgi:predicted transcriptional regulator|nr:BlaI/MecI/CopY family transcriptional regulator [Steroidobacteraceae bacterium]
MKRTARSSQHSKPLTAVELEMMNVIWRIGPCTVAQVREQLQPARELAYTSISTIVRILEQKGYVTSEREGRGHLYAASISKEIYQARSLKHLLNNVFESAPSLLVRHLLDSETLTSAEMAEIKSLLRKRER